MTIVSKIFAIAKAVFSTAGKIFGYVAKFIVCKVFAIGAIANFDLGVARSDSAADTTENYALSLLP